MKSNTFRYLNFIWVLCLSIFSVESAAQKLPVDAYLQVNAPYSVFYTEYYASSSNLLEGTLIFQDFSEPSWDVRLRLEIENSSIHIVTKQNFSPLTPITLTPGVATSITGSDWADYFNLDNVDISGITREELARNGTLPEGFYRFNITVLDYATGKELSKTGSATAWLSLGEPPMINWPQCGSIVAAQDPQNIIFQWQDRNITSANSEVNYKFFLYEITDNDVEPLYAIENGKALLIFETSDLSTNNLQYDLSMTPLMEGKKYLFRIQSYDPAGKNTYKNDGYSQNCWFYYGYPSGGKIVLRDPSNDFKFTQKTPRLFSWTAPDKLMNGQSFNYKMKIIALDGDPKDQDLEGLMEETEAWSSEETNSTTSRNDYFHTVEKPFEDQRNYAWQVTAYTDGQQIAKSDIRVFQGPSLIDYFWAGRHKVNVLNVSNADLNKLAGEGLVKLTEAKGDSGMVKVSFSDLHVTKSGGEYVLFEGEIIQVLQNKSIVLSPETEVNGEASFKAEKLRLNSEGLYMYGLAKWALPHPVLAEELAYITTESDWLYFDYFKLQGVLKLKKGNDFELMDPLGFRLDFHQTSDFEIYNDQYTLYLDGDLYLPTKAHDLNNKRISFGVHRIGQLDYFTQDDLRFTEPIAFVDQTKLKFSGINVVVDFSEKKSPPKLENDKEWKGLYFTDFSISYPKDVDNKRQLIFSREDVSQFELNMSNDLKAWVTTEGLTTYFHDTFEYGSTGTFNQFPANFTSFSVDVENNAVTDSEFKGNIKIPVFDPHKDFSFTIPMSNGGFESGYLDEKLEESSFVFSPYGGENRVDLTIKKAVFVKNERLDIVVDIEIPYINAKMSEVSDLRVYGDYYIGFGKRNGAQDLTEQVEGSYDGFKIYIDKIGCGLANGEYQFSYSATMPLGDEVSGENGAPRLDIHSSAPAGDNVASATEGTSAPAMDMPKPNLASASPQRLAIDSMSIEVKSEMIDCKGFLLVTKDDPTWGTSMQGGLKGELKIPTKVGLGTNMVLGTKDDMKYWYMDAWFVDSEGMGIPVFNMFNIVAFEGKVYRHMALAKSESGADKPNVTIDPNVEFGAGLYMQMVDPMGGKRFKSDVGIELLVEKEYFKVGMRGDLSMLNSEGRNNASLTSMATKIAAKEAAKQAAKELAKQIDIDMTVDLGNSKKMGVKANATKGEFSYSEADYGFKVNGDVGGVPAAGLAFYKGNLNLELNGSVDGQGSVNLSNGEDKIGMSYYETDGAAMNMQYKGVDLAASYNKSVGYGAFKLGYDQKLIDVSVNKTTGVGHLELALEENKKVLAKTNGEGGSEFQLKYDDVFVLLKGDKKENAGELGVAVGDNYVNAKLNQTKGTGALSFQLGPVYYDLTADKTGVADMTVEVDKDVVHLMVDKPAGKGEIEVSTGGNKVGVMLDKEGAGSLTIEKPGLKFGVTADKQAGSGGFLFDDGNTLLDVRANKSEGTGLVRVKTGQDSVFANLEKSNRELSMGIDGTYFSVKSESQEAGSLVLSIPKNKFEIGASYDKTAGTGAFNLALDSKKIEVEANESKKSGHIQLELDPTKSIYASADGNGGGDLKMNFDDVSVALSGNTTENAGSLEVKVGEEFIKGAANQSKGTGELAFKFGDVSYDMSANKTGVLDMSVKVKEDVVIVKADKPAKTGELAVTSGSNKVGVKLDGSGMGTLEIETSDLKLGVSADKSAGAGAFYYDDGKTALDVRANKSEKTGSVKIQVNSDSVIAAVSPTYKELKMNIDGTYFGISATGTNEGQIQLIKDDKSFDAGIKYDDKSGYLNLKDGENKISVNANGNTKSGEFNLDIDGVEVVAGRNATENYFSYADINLTLTGKGNSTKGAFGFTKDKNEVQIGLDKTTQEGILVLKNDQFALETSLGLESKKGTLSVEAEGNTFNLEVSPEERSVGFERGETSVLLTSKSSGDKSFSLSHDGYDVKYGNENSTHQISLSKNEMGIALSSSKEITISYKGDVFKANLDRSNFSLTQNGQNLSTVLSNSGNGAVNFSDYTNGGLQLTLAAQDGVYSLAYASDLIITYAKSGDKSLEFKADENYAFTLSGTNQVSFARGTNQKIQIDPTGSLLIENGSNQKFSLTKEQIDATLNNYVVSLSSSSIAFTDGNNKLALNKDEANWTQGDKKIRLTKDQTFELVANSSQSITLSPTLADLKYNDTKISLGTENGLNYSDNQRKFILSKSGVQVQDGDNSLAINASDKSLELKSGSSKSLKVSEQGLEMKYDDKEVSFGSSKSLAYKDKDRSFNLESAGLKYAEGDKKVEVRDEGGERSLYLAKSDKSFTYKNGEVQVVDGSNKLKLGGETYFDLDYAGKQVVIGEDLLKYKDGDRVVLKQGKQLDVSLNETQKMSLTPKGIALVYDKINVNVGNDKGLTYSDESRNFALTSDELKIQEGENSLSLNKTDKTLAIQSGANKSLKISQAGMEMKYDDKEVSFGSQKNLHYKDNTRTIDLATTGLKYEEGDKIIQVLDENGSRSLVLVKGDKSFKYQSGAATIADGNNTLKLGGDSYFDLNYEGKQILVAQDYLKYQEGSRLLAFGGNNFIEAREGERAVTFSKTKELTLIDGNRSLSVSPEKKIVAKDGSKTFTLGGDNLVAYSDDQFGARLYETAPKQYGLAITKDEYSLGLEGGKNKNATLTASVGEAVVSVSSDKQSNIVSTFAYQAKRYELKTGRQGLTFSGLAKDGGATKEAKPEKLEGAADAEYSGPQYIGKITDGSDGRVKGFVEMSYNSKDQHFIANAAVESVAPPCVKAALAIDASPKTYSIDIGTETQRIEIYPTCTGFGGGGWLHVDPKLVKVGIFAGYKAGGSIDIGVAEIGATLSAELGVKATAEIDPKFLIREVGVWVEVSAGVWVDPVIGSRFDIAAVYLKGTLTLYFYDKTEVKGSLAGKVTICGISESFDMSFDKTL